MRVLSKIEYRISTIRRLAAAIGFLGLMVLGPAAHAGSPAALALEVAGPTAPTVEPFSEFESRKPIKLEANTSIEFLHYATCQTVTVKGGRLSFTRQRFLLKGGKILSTKRAECPKTVTLSGASRIGGVVLRSAKNSTLRVNTKPSFVLVGAKADGFASIRITLNGKTILESVLAGRAFLYPESIPPLEDKVIYKVFLKPAAGGKEQNFSFKTRGRSKRTTLMLIRVD